MLHTFYLCILLCGIGSYALYDNDSDVVELTPANFEELVTKSNEIWVVEFYAPWCGHCKKLVPVIKKTAQALKGIAKVGVVNGHIHTSLASEYGANAFPHIQIFAGKKNNKYVGERTATGFVDAALNAAKKRAYQVIGVTDKGPEPAVIELTESNFKELVLESDDFWLVEFFAPWCGHCKNLEPHWAKAASELKGKVKLGAVDSTVHQSLSARFGVQGYPTIKAFPAGKKTSDSAEDYNGGRTSSDIVSWALSRWTENVPAPEVLQIVDSDSMKACSEKPLCVVSILPHILDCNAACRNEYIKILTELGDKYKNKLWGWVWAEAGAQAPLEAALEIGGFGYPAMAVVNTRKLKFSALKGSFSQQGINEFLRDLSFGRGQSAPVRLGEMPEVTPTEPWDGKDGVLPQEEDIDLSDIDLDKDEL